VLLGSASLESCLRILEKLFQLTGSWHAGSRTAKLGDWIWVFKFTKPKEAGESAVRSRQ